jgi:hypothetical protein
VKPEQINPAQFRALQCPHCLGRLFEPIMLGPVLVDRLDVKHFAFNPGQGLRCAGCLKLFDPAVAAGLKDQEISSA